VCLCCLQQSRRIHSTTSSQVVAAAATSSTAALAATLRSHQSADGLAQATADVAAATLSAVRFAGQILLIPVYSMAAGSTAHSGLCIMTPC
jgi:hypothetical protein